MVEHNQRPESGMKALILSAGQGSRLLPLTADRPKCLLPLDSMTVLEWQIRELQRCGINEIVVVVGFQAAAVERFVADLRSSRLAIRTVFNPFYQVADNLSSCWMARHEMRGNFLLLNGDTVFESEVAARLIVGEDAPITIAIDHSSDYDADDMKVRLAGRRVLEIGKWLPAEHTDGESIGMMRFRDDGATLFVDELDRVMRTPEGLDYWYTTAIGTLATTGAVSTVSIEGLDWGEVDYPVDLQRVRAMVRNWTAGTAVAAGSRAST